jgi:aspartyl/asparaginyl beta-hydroxylase (cupin superfamily)
MPRSELQIDEHLRTNPADVQALVEKADHQQAAGRPRQAASFYRAALQAAGQAAARGPLPMQLKAPIERAQQALARLERSFETILMEELSQAGFPAGNRPPRFQRSLDLLTGRAQAQMSLQRPTAYFYPDLPQRPYFERAEFSWASDLERQTELIRAELLAWLDRGGEGFAPYLVSDPTRPRSGFHGLLDNPAWSTLYLTTDGQILPELARHFPVTLAALEKAPLARIGKRAPSILFSRLAPGASIPPHHGMLNARLICHLPLIVPSECGFRVATEVRQWNEGQLLIFDDSVEHEAWNHSKEDRFLLIFDIWRPELDEPERRAITKLFEVLDAQV